MSRRNMLLLAVLVALVGAYFAFDLGRFLSLAYLQDQRAALTAAFHEQPLLVAGGFFLAYVAVTALSLPGAAVMTLAAGAVFGIGWGLLLVSFASSIGATLAMLVARLLLRDTVQGRFGRQLRTINEGIERDGAFYLFTLRLVPLFPFFVINLVMGLTPMKALTFYWVSQVGMLAGTVVFVFAGTQLAEVRSLGDILSPGLLVAFALLGIFPWIARKVVQVVAARKHLAGWDKPKSFDNNLIVIGAGSGGLIASLIAATVKAKVTLIERGEMGGDCLNTGCVPSKTLLASAKVAHTARKGSAGVRAGDVQVDFPAVMQRVHDAIATIAPHDSVERYTGLGVNVIKGEARLVDPWTVEVNGERITGRRIVLATGGRPAMPHIPGLADVDPLDSDTVWGLTELPERLLVVGAGPIGCELAQAFVRLGSRVTQVTNGDRVLPKEDTDAADIVAAALRADGIDLRLSTRAVAFRQGEDGGVASMEGPDGELEVVFDRVLVAVGRRAITAGLGIEELGIRTRDDGTVDVDAFLQTSLPTVYACGDVTGPYLFTHMASHQAWFAAVNALFGTFWRFKVNYSVVPWATYTDPEVAHAGLTEAQAQEQGEEVEVTRFDLSGSDRAIAEGATDGFVKVITPAGGDDKVLGVTIVGPHAGDLLHEYVLAMSHGLGLKKLMGTIHVYPTLAEANKSAASAWRKKHVPEDLLGHVQRLHGWMRG